MTTLDVDRARAWWDQGDAIRAGHVVYLAMPTNMRPLWAAGILELCLERIEAPAAVANVLAIARDETRWPEAHGAFSGVRDLTLAYEKQRKKKRQRSALYGALLYVAETVAKVTYNASKSPAPFDADSGAWLVNNLRHFAITTDDPGALDRAWGRVVAPL